MGLLYFEYIYVINNIVELFYNITVFATRTDFNSSYSYVHELVHVSELVCKIYLNEIFIYAVHNIDNRIRNYSRNYFKEHYSNTKY